MSKDYFENPISNFHYASKHFGQIYKVVFANLFHYEKLFSYCLEMLFWILEIFRILFELIWSQNAKDMKESKKEKKKRRNIKKDKMVAGNQSAQSQNRPTTRLT
jgi:hypothetical protein